jgi:hypothetical protein
MREFTTDGKTYRFQWASDGEFDGIRLEAIVGDDVILDISVPDKGAMSLNTFGWDVPVDLVVAVLDIARQDKNARR